MTTPVAPPQQEPPSAPWGEAAATCCGAAHGRAGALAGPQTPTIAVARHLVLGDTALARTWALDRLRAWKLPESALLPTLDAITALLHTPHPAPPLPASPPGGGTPTARWLLLHARAGRLLAGLALTAPGERPGLLLPPSGRIPAQPGETCHDTTSTGPCLWLCAHTPTR